MKNTRKKVRARKQFAKKSETKMNKKKKSENLG